MFILYTILDPKVKLYFMDHNHFSTFEVEAYQFNTREEALEISDQFPFDLQIEKIG